MATGGRCIKKKMAMFSQIALSVLRKHLQIILCKQTQNRFCALSHPQLSGISDSSPDSSSSLALLWNRLFGSGKQTNGSID
jgi:hypothetical protein